MIKENIQKAINEQINKEFFSAYLYLSMAQHFETKNLTGMAKWLFIQYKEELSHAEKFMGYMNERGGVVELTTIEKPKTKWGSTLEAFQDAYNHEVFISESINKIAGIARTENDFATEDFLAWFINEQLEEEQQTLDIVLKLKLIGEAGQALYMLDKELGQRGAG
ncbi:MAG: ferritin [Caldisericaceae bacterium]